jgi:hypothetical protein
MSEQSLTDAMTRISGILDGEERRKLRLNAMMQRLRTEGWTPPRPAASSQGPTVADAARAIRARLDADDALRVEALRQLAATDRADAEGDLGFPRASSEANEIADMPLADDTVAPGNQDTSLGFKRHDSIAEWRSVIPAMAEYVGVDPELAVRVDAEIVPILAGVHGYRHLDRFAKEKLMGKILNLERDHPRLARRLRGQVAFAVASPLQAEWSMSDDELRQRIQTNMQLLEKIDIAGDVEDAIGIGSTTAAALGVARNLSVPTAIGSGSLLAFKYMIKGEIADLEAELERRRQGSNPFDRR